MADASGLNADRLHQEAVMAATRADVREELDRLRSHIASARALITSGDAVGRRLDFLRRSSTVKPTRFARRRLTSS